MKLVKKIGLPILFGVGIYLIYDSHKHKTFYYEKCCWTQTNEKVRQILDNSYNTRFRYNYSRLFQSNDDETIKNNNMSGGSVTTSNECLLLVSNRTELFKDIWNQQIYKLWSWLHFL